MLSRPYIAMNQTTVVAASAVSHTCAILRFRTGAVDGGGEAAVLASVVAATPGARLIMPAIQAMTNSSSTREWLTNATTVNDSAGTSSGRPAPAMTLHAHARLDGVGRHTLCLASSVVTAT